MPGPNIQTIVVFTENTTVVGADAAGPQGVPGPSGDSASGFNFTQGVADTSWVINHNLGYRPVVDVFTVGGVIMLAEVVHVSNNQVLVTLNTAQTGSARLV